MQIDAATGVTSKPRPLRSVRYGLVLAIASAAALLLAPLLYRTHLTGLLPALLLVPFAAVLSIVAAILSAIGIIAAQRRHQSRDATRAVMGIVIAIVVLAVLGSALVGARRSAVIHDVTTDTENPPAFVAVLPHRRGALNPVEYGGSRIAALQQQSYPDITPLRLDVPAREAFDRALAAARASGWELVAADPAAGRIEATDTTFWFGFKDDVVVRVRSEGNGSRIDVRSLSRVGGGDLGTNANRIRAYVRRLPGHQVQPQ